MITKTDLFVLRDVSTNTHAHTYTLYGFHLFAWATQTRNLKTNVL